MIPRLVIHGFDFFVQPTRTRFPFRYGIASMTEVPHLFVRVATSVAGRGQIGLAAEGLPPKWFTKDPATTFEQDLPQMLEVIRHAAELASTITTQPVSFFDFWQELYREQAAWANRENYAPLLANLGVSLVERAVLDALCRAVNRSLHEVIRLNLLGIELREVYPELPGQPREYLSAEPRARILARHTVGLGDPLTPDEIPASERLNDGLPHDLQACIRAYQLRAFKVKLSGDRERDRSRLGKLSDLLGREVRGDFLVTLDGNENFKSFAAFRDFWENLVASGALGAMAPKVAVVEQPVHRDHALNDEAAAQLQSWPDRPPLIIDESEAALGDLSRALEIGYIGTSHKNCKGIIKGIANACLIEMLRREGRQIELTGEDLANLGPVALLQDLAMMALLGIEHVERNGHHYFRGLSLWPEEWQQTMLREHGDLYAPHPAGFAALQIRAGQLDLASVNRAPFGVTPLLDPSGFERTS